ncbi:hypothetical protein EAI_15567 [Harpegnathos saltator]|uniref:Uncharacterized protein n=1 Tax=Harpegnathos saltator TaxID=610380 RepID=E2B7E6_HARSA|nr:hypothetical protein EAI_15567 [Harpegnathos saltator]
MAAKFPTEREHTTGKIETVMAIINMITEDGLATMSRKQVALTALVEAYYGPTTEMKITKVCEFTRVHIVILIDTQCLLSEGTMHAGRYLPNTKRATLRVLTPVHTRLGLAWPASTPKVPLPSTLARNSPPFAACPSSPNSSSEPASQPASQPPYGRPLDITEDLLLMQTRRYIKTIYFGDAAPQRDMHDQRNSKRDVTVQRCELQHQKPRIQSTEYNCNIIIKAIVVSTLLSICRIALLRKLSHWLKEDFNDTMFRGRTGSGELHPIDYPLQLTTRIVDQALVMKEDNISARHRNRNRASPYARLNQHLPSRPH